MKRRVRILRGVEQLCVQVVTSGIFRIRTALAPEVRLGDLLRINDQSYRVVSINSSSEISVSVIDAKMFEYQS